MKVLIASMLILFLFYCSQFPTLPNIAYMSDPHPMWPPARAGRADTKNIAKISPNLKVCKFSSRPRSDPSWAVLFCVDTSTCKMCRYIDSGHAFSFTANMGQYNMTV